MDIRKIRCTVPCDPMTAENGCHCAEARDEITRLRGMLPRPIEEAPKDREVIGVERPFGEDQNYFHLGQWNEKHQQFMSDAGYDSYTGARRWAFCGVTHYIDPEAVPLLPEHVFEDGDDD
jgi:hypothetical protein